MVEHEQTAALVIGAGGGIGAALLAALLADSRFSRVYGVSRGDIPRGVDAGEGRLSWLRCDHSDAAIADVLARIRDDKVSLSRVIICTGMLHQGELQPEKAIERINEEQMLAVLRVNTVLPSLWLGGLMAQLDRDAATVIAVLSARVGSIGDNRLGGWYSYRASKAALNMVLKTAAVELARRKRRTKLIAFHPGTTDTPLSQPFQARVPPEKLFTPAFVAQRLLALMDDTSADGELAYLDWAGETIPW